MQANLTRKIAWLTAVQFLLFVVATVLVAIYYSPDPDMPYYTIIDFGVIAEGLRNLSLSSIGDALNELPALLGIPLLLLSFLGLRLSHDKQPLLTGVLFSVQSVLLLMALGLMGLMAIPFLLFTQQPIDGEVLGEHWPQLIANGLNALISFYLAVCALLTARAHRKTE